MTIKQVIHKLEFSINAYQKLIDEHVADGEIIGTGVKGEWQASTPLTEVYQSHIDAFKIAKGIIEDYERRLKSDLAAMLTEVSMEIGEIEGGYSDFDEENGRMLTMIPLEDVDRIIQEKIDRLKADVEGK